MCGITGYYLRNPNLSQHVDIDGLLDELLLGIESRGRDATGFVAISENGVAEWQKAATDVKTFNTWRRPVPRRSRVVLGHTRWATQGLPSFMENNHPIQRGPFFIIHNGHVQNDKELFESAERTRFAQVDSEAIAARLASLKDLSALRDVMAEIEGDAAVAAVDSRDPTRLVLAKGAYSPLYVYDGRSIVIFSSTKDAIEKAHKKYIGHIADSRLKPLFSGDQVEWRGEEKIVSEFEVKYRKFLSSTWQGKSQKALPAGSTSHLWDDAWDDKKEYACDNCGEELNFRQTHWRYDQDESYTYTLCLECRDLWDDGYFVLPDGTVSVQDDIEAAAEAAAQETIESIAPITGGFFDEYEQANNSILGRMGNLLGL